MAATTAAEQTLKLVESLKFLKNSRSPEEVRGIMQQLLKLDFRVPFMTSDIGQDVLNICVLHCSSVSSPEADLTKQLIWALQTSAENQITLELETLLHLINFCLAGIPSEDPQRTILSFHALGTLVYKNSHRLESIWCDLYRVIRGCLTIEESNVSVRHSALKVLQALTVKDPDEENFLSPTQCHEIAAMIIVGVADTFVSTDEKMLCKVLQASIKTLINLSSAPVPLQCEQLGFLLGWLRHLTFYGFPGYASRPIKNFDLFPSPVCHQLPKIDLKENESSKDRTVVKKSRAKRKSKNKSDSSPADSSQDPASEDSDSSSTHHPPWVVTDSSDSELSESETSTTSQQCLQIRIKNQKAKVRQLAYDAIRMLLLSIDKKERFGYLLNFLPQQSGSLMRSTEHTLVLSMLKDPCAHVRTCAINVLKDFITYSKQYLVLACESPHSTSFTSVSEVMAIVITELHRALHLALLAEQIPIFLGPLLSCLCLLISASPYNKLKPLLVIEMIGDLKTLLNNKYEQVRGGALRCFGELVNFQPEHTEIVNLLGFQSDHWFEVTAAEKFKSESNEVNQVKLDYLQTLSLLVNNHFKYCEPIFGTVYIPIIEAAVNSSYNPIRIHGIKLSGNVAKQISKMIAEHDEEIGYGFANLLWEKCLFKGPLQSCFQNDTSVEFSEHAVKERLVMKREAFTTLALIGSGAWERLPCSFQKFCICVLLNQVRETKDDLAVAAIKTLAVFCTFRSMSQDAIFLQDVGEVCVALLKQKISVTLKLKVSWALSNVCDALTQLKRCDIAQFEENISVEFYRSLLQISIDIYPDKDAVKLNAVRSMGLLLSIADEHYIEGSLSFCTEAVQLVLKSATHDSDRFFKAKWNACYALGAAMRNPHSRPLLDMSQSLKALSDNLVSCYNLKVQIACISALDQLADCDGLDESMHEEIFKALVEKGVGAPCIMVDYKELHHLKVLKENLCLAFLRYLQTADETLCDKLFLLIYGRKSSLETLFRNALSNEILLEKVKAFSGTPRGMRLIEVLPSLGKHLQLASELYLMTA